MVGRFTAAVLAEVLCVAALSSAFGHSDEVRERMMVRNLARARLDDSVRPVLARDAAVGQGIFDYSSGPTGFGWPLIATATASDSMSYNIAVLDSGGCLLSRTRMSQWLAWDPVVDVADSGNQPMFETHNIASSPDSGNVCITWVRTDTSPMPGYYRISGDGGANWDSVQQLDWPAAYGGDTLTSFHVSSLYPFYDEDNRLNVVAAVHPIVNDTAFIMPAGIWHWCPDNNPTWRLLRLARCAPEHLAAPVGYNALYACRPSGCHLSGGALLVTWEQFDSADVDPQTNLLRAGVHACVFEGGGPHLDTLRVTVPGPYSCRFPVPTSYSLGTTDSTFVAYEVDRIAGFSSLGQGSCTSNPVLARRLALHWWTVELGSLDTIGGTTYDLQTCGPARTLVHGAPRGVHAMWMYSGDTTGSFPDLNMRYNFYEYDFRCWSWVDSSNFMQSGVYVFPYRTGLGSIDVDTTGVAVISACTPPPLPQVTVGESRQPQAPSFKPAFSIVRWTLFLPPYPLSAPFSLLSVDGRKVQDLRPGANDVSALSPGVYFVREERQASSPGHQAVRKVVITR